MQIIAILGSTGSIGTQALDVISHYPERFRVDVLAAYKNVELMEQQIRKFQPRLAVLVDEAAAERLRQCYSGPTKILAGQAALEAVAAETKANIVLTSLVGFAGLKPTIAAIRAGKDIALANKETLVAAGHYIVELAKKHQVKLLPVDSEHSAVFQCLQGISGKAKKIYLTASGGPFLGYTEEELKHVTLAECLKHPNWSMGPKVTIDSSTLANKGLEVMEAHWLFDMPYEAIQVVVHPQSIVHSMIQTSDGSVLAQLGQPDMRLPIQYALSYPERLTAHYPELDFRQSLSLTFLEPDVIRFPALKLAYAAGKRGGSLPCVFNAANEVAVQSFMEGKISYLAIAELIEKMLAQHDFVENPGIDDIFAVDEWTRRRAAELLTDQKI